MSLIICEANVRMYLIISVSFFLVAADPALVPTPSSGEPILNVPERRSPGLFGPEEVTGFLDATWDFPTPETQIVDIQMWDSVPSPNAQQPDLPPDEWRSVPKTKVTKANKAERQQQEMPTRRLHESPGMPGPSNLTEDKRRQIQDWASWIREF